jgi:hypothetical protein
MPEETFTDDSSPQASLQSLPTSGSFSILEKEYSDIYEDAAATNLSSTQHQTKIFQDISEWRTTSSFPPEPLNQDPLGVQVSPYSQTALSQIGSTGYDMLTSSLLSTSSLVPEGDWHLQHQDTTPGVYVPFETFLSSDWPGSAQAAIVPDESFTSPPGFGEDDVDHSPPQAQLQGLAFSSSLHDDRSTSPHAPQESSSWPSICLQCSSSSSNSPSLATVYENFGTWLVHNWTAHSGLYTWLPMRCPWEDPPCTNPNYFKTQKHWLDHVSIVHQKTFFCDRPDCKQRRGGPEEIAFGTTADLKRHDQSIHETPIYCRKPYCKGRKAKLNRKDKRDIHESRYHGRFSCDFNGCLRRRIDGIDYGFLDQKRLDVHMRDAHHQRPSHIESD